MSSRPVMIFLAIIFSVILPIAASAQKSLKADHVEVSLISPQEMVENERKLLVGVRFKIDPEWHIYWKNPGDSGAAPKFLVEGATLEKVNWPYPIRLPVKDLTNYGYEHEVVFPLQLHVLDSNQQNQVHFDLEWLVCKIECIPGFGTLKYSYKKAEQEKLKSETDSERVQYEEFVKRVPSSGADWELQFLKMSDKQLTFSMKTEDLTKLKRIQEIWIYPENGLAFQTTLPEVKFEDSSGSLIADFIKISVPLSANAKPQKVENFTFVIGMVGGTFEAFEKTLSTQKQAKTSLWLGLLLAAVGGMILNLMPCVFPILSLKIFSFVKDPDQNKIKQSAWVYSAGVVLSFVLIGGLLSFLRISGEAVGWGYQLQSPGLVYALTLLFFVMSLNFYGFFEMGDSLMAWAGEKGKSQWLSGDFGTGVLAVIVASPCTAPFMGTALGLTLLLPIYQSLLIFAALGIGMALPMLVLSYVPGLGRRLPRSGAWMLTLKQFMAFPLVLTSVWLLWVLGNQKGSDSIFAALISFVLIVMGIWALRVMKNTFAKFVVKFLLVVTPIVLGVWITKQTLEVGAISKEDVWKPFDPELIKAKRKTQTVFVDFTASWCITCQVNKKTVLNSEKIQNLFVKHNVYLMKADWTNRDPVVTNALAEFGRQSVPLYVIYQKGMTPQTMAPHILPELLTQDMLINYFEKGETP